MTNLFEKNVRSQRFERMIFRPEYKYGENLLIYTFLSPHCITLFNKSKLPLQAKGPIPIVFLSLMLADESVKDDSPSGKTG